MKLPSNPTIFDLEGNGLYFELTKFWCMAIKQPSEPAKLYLDTTLWDSMSRLEKLLYGLTEASRGGTFEEGLSILRQSKILSGHSIIDYDLPALRKMCNDWTPNKKTKIVDTLVVSRLYNPDRVKPSSAPSKGGPHSLSTWGYRVGRGKVENEEWKVFSPNILRRCLEDVEINYLTYEALSEEGRGHDWKESLDIEHKIQEIITNQDHCGVNFDLVKAQGLVTELTCKVYNIDKEYVPSLPSSLKIPYKTSIDEPFKRDGEVKATIIKWYGDRSDQVKGPFTRILFEPFPINSTAKVKDYLLSQNWIPTEYNISKKTGERSSPKLTEDSFSSIEGTLPKAIKNRVLFSHRKSNIDGLINRLRPDGRISAGANPCGTPTGRMRHRGVVNIPKADPSIPYGTEMRSLFKAREGWVFVGHDASGLELRMLAHYMNDEAYTYEVVHGDIHTANQRAAGLSTRDQAKTFIYGFNYGAGDQKLGSIIGGGAEDGAKLRRSFLDTLPKLEELINRVKRASKKGYLRGLDSRKVWMRRNDEGRVMEHKALNTLLQSAGAIVMKKSTIILREDCLKEGVIYNKVIDMHDEGQAEVHPNDVEKYMNLAEQSIVKAGLHFNLRCPLDAKAKQGLNWSETH